MLKRNLKIIQYYLNIIVAILAIVSFVLYFFINNFTLLIILDILAYGIFLFIKSLYLERKFLTFNGTVGAILISVGIVSLFNLIDIINILAFLLTILPVGLGSYLIYIALLYFVQKEFNFNSFILFFGGIFLIVLGLLPFIFENYAFFEDNYISTYSAISGASIALLIYNATKLISYYKKKSKF